MLEHFSLRCSDSKASRRFYERALKPLGYMGDEGHPAGTGWPSGATTEPVGPGVQRPLPERLISLAPRVKVPDRPEGAGAMSAVRGAAKMALAVTVLVRAAMEVLLILAEA
jgi:hypothetical protein